MGLKRKPPLAAAPTRDIQTLLDRAWEQFDAATKDVDENGAIHTTEKGYRYANPAVNQRKEASATIAKLTAQIAADKSKQPAGVMSRKR